MTPAVHRSQADEPQVLFIPAAFASSTLRRLSTIRGPAPVQTVGTSSRLPSYGASRRALWAPTIVALPMRCWSLPGGTVLTATVTARRAAVSLFTVFHFRIRRHIAIRLWPRRRHWPQPSLLVCMRRFSASPIYERAYHISAFR